MKRTIKIYLILIFLGNAFSTHAQVLTLDSILSAIRENNHMIHEYDWKIEAMKSYAEGAKSWDAPMVGIGPFMKAYPFQEIMEERDKGSVMISIQQEIPNPAKLKAKKEFYDSRAAIEESGREVTFNQLRAQAKQLYYQWKVLEKKMQVLKESEAIMSTMKKLAEIRYPYSKGTLGNIYKAEGRLYEVQNMILMTETEIEQKNILLNTLMEIDKKTKYQIDTSGLKIEEVLVDTFDIVEKRSDIRRIQNNINSMQLSSRLTGLQSKPDFSVRFDNMSPIGKGMPQMFTVMAMMSIPIAPWSSKMYKSEVKGMQNEIKGMEMEKAGLISEAEGMLKSMEVEIKKMNLQMENYKKKIIPALKKNYDVEMLAYEENKSELPMVIDAWEALNMAQIEYLNKQEQLYLMLVNYEKELEK